MLQKKANKKTLKDSTQISSNKDYKPSLIQRCDLFGEAIQLTLDG